MKIKKGSIIVTDGTKKVRVKGVVGWSLGHLKQHLIGSDCLDISFLSQDKETQLTLEIVDPENNKPGSCGLSIRANVNGMHCEDNYILKQNDTVQFFLEERSHP